MPRFFFITQNTGAGVDYVIGILHFAVSPPCFMQILAALQYKAPNFPLSATFGTKIFFRGFLFPMSLIVPIQNLVALRLIV